MSKCGFCNNMSKLSRKFYCTFEIPTNSYLEVPAFLSYDSEENSDDSSDKEECHNISKQKEDISISQFLKKIFDR